MEINGLNTNVFDGHVLPPERVHSEKSRFTFSCTNDLKSCL